MLRNPYHSALFDSVKVDKELQGYSSNGSMVFVHDILEGVRDGFRTAEVIYGDLAWRDGYKKFMKKAGKVPKGNYNTYLWKVREAILELKVPTFLVVGKHALDILQPDRQQYISIHGGDAVLAIWNYDGKLELDTNANLGRWVFEEYNNVLNFCCGYGSCLIFAERYKKKFIFSDINAKCVYFVAKTYMGYKDEDN